MNTRLARRQPEMNGDRRGTGVTSPRGGGRSVLLAMVAAAMPAAAQEPVIETVPFEPGMIVTRSVRIEPGTYEVAGAASLDSALIIVRGTGIILDMTGVELRGTPARSDPDTARGTALLVDGGVDVTVKGATIRGYRFAILARGTRGLRLLDNEVSYNWKPRLFSLVAHESLVDWLSYHQNEDREWMRFGAAIYVEGVEGGVVRGNRAIQGMNGLLLVRTDSLRIEDNEFAFNSGLGIGLYRSSDNEIVRNRLDFNVRGYSHGFYNRGQDSAGILLYEQSSRNIVAYNSVTHGGDGLFLWAGQSTMDTGEGGANDNLIFHNDFNYAPTNSVEITFSRNRVIANRLQGSRYGIWGGYSWESVVLANCFGGNETGIAIEHGQDNVVEGNWFAGDETAIQIWANASEPADWGYPGNRDTRSRDTRIRANRFSGHETVWQFDNTTGLDIGMNRTEPPVEDEACDPLELLGDDVATHRPDLPGVPPEIPDVSLAARDRSAMVVDEWGPYDWASPKLWPTDTTRAVVPLRVLGPPGRWTVTDRRGLTSVSAESGSTGDTLIVTPAPGREGDWAVDLEYRGEVTRGPRGREAAPGEPVPFAYERYDPIDGWDVAYHEWSDPETDPATDPAAFEALLESSPLLRRAEPALDLMWYRPTIEGLPEERWAFEATSTVSLPPGDYSLRTISDDGIRVWVDGRLVIDRFDPHGSEVDYATVSAGRHDLKVQYYQLGGWSEVRVEIIRGNGRSRGSAGPH